MFSGIVERTSRVASIRPSVSGARMRVGVGAIATECALGASVAIAGVCLTVAAVDNDALEFDVISETLRRTKLGDLKVGDSVNVERSLRVGDRIDGHFVQGHVDGVATVSQVQKRASDYLVWMRAPEELKRFIVAKGSIAVDGVSLTVASTTAVEFSVALIPTTLERTTLGSLAVGDRVNLESDVLARTVIHCLSSREGTGGLSQAMLQEAGFA